MRTWGLVLVVGAAAAARADLYGVGFAECAWRMYRISTTDASIEALSFIDDLYDLGILEITLGPDGHIYGVNALSIFRIDVATGQSEFILDVPGNCLFPGSLTVTEAGTLFAGVGLFCSGFLGWNVFCGHCGDTFVDVPQRFLAWVAQYRDDGVLLAMEYRDPTVYAIDIRTDEIHAIGMLDIDSTPLSFELDPATGNYYLLAGDINEDQMSLYAFDPYTLKTELIGPLPNGINFYGIAGIPCAADFNRDGSLDILDFLAFQVAFQDGDGAADVNGDGVLNVLDFLAFQMFFKGDAHEDARTHLARRCDSMRCVGPVRGRPLPRL